jgi:hypothetical protein
LRLMRIKIAVGLGVICLLILASFGRIGDLDRINLHFGIR